MTASETKDHQLDFRITNTKDFFILNFRKCFYKLFACFESMNYVENSLDSIYKSLAWHEENHQVNVPTKFEMNILVSFEVIQIVSF